MKESGDLEIIRRLEQELGKELTIFDDLYPRESAPNETRNPRAEIKRVGGKGDGLAGEEWDG